MPVFIGHLGQHVPVSGIECKHDFFFHIRPSSIDFDDGYSVRSRISNGILQATAIEVTSDKLSPILKPYWG